MSHGVAAALLAGFAVLNFARLRANGFGAYPAGFLSLLGAFSLGAVFAAAGVVTTLIFSLAAYAIATSALRFLHRQTAREIVLLGGSLAGIQLATPLGGVIAAMFLPLIASASKTRNLGQTSSMLLLLLFLPLATAFVLTILAFERMRPLFSFLQLPFILLPPPDPAIWIPAAGAILLPPALATFLSRRRRSIEALSLLGIGAIILAAASVAAIMGAIRNPLEIAAFLAPLPPVMIAAWPRSAEQARDAVLAQCASTLLAVAFCIFVYRGWFP